MSLFLSQTDVMHQSVYELVHTEDQQELRKNLDWALNPPDPTSPKGDLTPHVLSFLYDSSAHTLLYYRALYPQRLFPVSQPRFSFLLCLCLVKF